MMDSEVEPRTLAGAAAIGTCMCALVKQRCDDVMGAAAMALAW